MNLGWTHPSAKAEADEIPDGPSCSGLRKMARETGLYLCSGLVERAGDRIFNAAVLVDPKGDVTLHYRKLHELEIGHDLYALGDRLQVAQTSLGTIGLMICADAFAPGQVISRTLGYMGAQIILSPSAWAVPADHDNQKEPYGALGWRITLPWRAIFGSGLPGPAMSVGSPAALGQDANALAARWSSVPRVNRCCGGRMEKRPKPFSMWT